VASAKAAELQRAGASFAALNLAACCPTRRLLTRVAQALALGIADDPAVLDALHSLQEQTEGLETLAVQQKEGTRPRRWWADGEYDDARADAANDAGA